MGYDEKCNILNSLLEPFGYSYLPSQDVFTSRIDAWQRSFGYCTLYDKAAYRFGMVFDCIPVYFDYNGRTWLIEFWKGQYGINTGAEIGIYYADEILNKADYNNTLFKCVENFEMPVFSFKLYKNDTLLSSVSARHWWLTSFTLGLFSKPEALCMRIGVTFNNKNMCPAFVQGLLDAGYDKSEINILRDTVIFGFDKPYITLNRYTHWRMKLAQTANHFWCKMYLHVTKPFTLSVDRCLYLYYHLPFIFRKTLRIKKFRKNIIKRRVG